MPKYFPSVVSPGVPVCNKVLHNESSQVSIFSDNDREGTLWLLPCALDVLLSRLYLLFPTTL